MNTIKLGSPENSEFAQIMNLALECNQEGISVVENRLGSIKIKVAKDSEEQHFTIQCAKKRDQQTEAIYPMLSVTHEATDEIGLYIFTDQGLKLEGSHQNLNQQRVLRAACKGLSLLYKIKNLTQDERTTLFSSSQFPRSVVDADIREQELNIYGENYIDTLIKQIRLQIDEI